MNKSFATYTPRVRPMEYDAIAGRDGCEPESGNDFYGLRAFEELCVAAHDADSLVFGQPATASYSFGPFYKGIPLWFNTEWSVWVATAGVRAGKVGKVTPPANGLGEVSNLYPETAPTHITHAWSGEGLLAIAIQKDEDTIELKQYDDATGTDIDTYTWEGRSPALFSAGLVVKGEDAPSGLVCYYLKAEDPRILYARFERDLYAIERIILPSVRVSLERLIRATSHDTKVLLYALDDRGRDITLTSPRHPITDSDSATLDVALVGGDVFVVGVEAGSIGLDAATLDIGAPFGQVFSPLIAPVDPPPTEAVSLSVAFVGGEVQ